MKMSRKLFMKNLDILAATPSARKPVKRRAERYDGPRPSKKKGRRSATILTILHCPLPAPQICCLMHTFQSFQTFVQYLPNCSSVAKRN